MLNFFITLPLIVLALGFLVGRARLKTAGAFMVVWALLGELSICIGFFVTVAIDNPFPLFVGIWGAVVLALPSIWFAVLWSLATSKKVTPTPAKVAIDAYGALSETHKARLSKALRASATVGARHLRQRGYGLAGDILGVCAEIL